MLAPHMYHARFVALAKPSHGARSPQYRPDRGGYRFDICFESSVSQGPPKIRKSQVEVTLHYALPAERTINGQLSGSEHELKFRRDPVTRDAWVARAYVSFEALKKVRWRGACVVFRIKEQSICQQLDVASEFRWTHEYARSDSARA